MQRRLVVRRMHPCEEQLVYNFYQENQHRWVREREEAELLEAMKTGGLFIAQEHHFWDGCRSIVGVSAVFDAFTVDLDDNDEIYSPRGEPLHEIRHFECGGTLMAPEYRGIGFHRFFLFCRLVHAALQVSPSELDALVVFSCTNPQNERSKNGIRKAGFSEWDCPYPDELKPMEDDELRSLPPGRDHKLDFFKAQPQAFKIAAGVVLTGDQILSRKGNDAEAELLFDIGLLSDSAQRRRVEALANDGFAGLRNET